MDAAVGVRVVGNDEPGVLGSLPGDVLELAHDVRVVVHVVGHAPPVAPARDLDDPEGELRVTEERAPVRDDRREGAVEGLPALREGVVLPLIEEHPAHGGLDDGAQRAVQHPAGLTLRRRVLVEALVRPRSAHLLVAARLAHLLLPGLHVFLEAPLRSRSTAALMPGRELRLDVVEVGLHLGEGAQGLLRHPVLRHRAAPRVVDEPDRHVEPAPQPPREVVTDPCAVGGLLRDAATPLATVRALLHGEVSLRLEVSDLREAQVADRGRVRRLHLDVGVAGGAQRPLHVALSAADPDLAHEDVGEGDPLLPALHDELPPLEALL